MWVKAVDLYSHVLKDVGPKREKLALAQVPFQRFFLSALTFRSAPAVATLFFVCSSSGRAGRNIGDAEAEAGQAAGSGEQDHGPGKAVQLQPG